MALSFVIKETKNTSDHTYGIPFSVLDNSHIKLLVTPAGGGAQVAHTNFTLNTTGTVMTIAGSYDVPLKIYRETPGTTDATKNTKFVYFVNGATNTETDLDNSTLQAIYATQESVDHVNTTVTESTGSGDMPSPANINYMLASSPVGGSLGATWISGTDIDSLIGVTTANTANKIPRRNAAATPAITTDLVGNVTGNATGSAGSLAPGGTIGITGDVTYTSPTFTGATVTGVGRVDKINTVAVTAAVAGDDTKVLTYNHTSARWEPDYAPAARIAVLAKELSGTTEGKATAATTWESVPLDTAVDNASLSTATVFEATNGVIRLTEAGVYRINWDVAIYSTQTAFTQLVASDADTTSSGLLSSSPAHAGKALVTRNPGTGSSSLSHGYARVTITGTRYLQLQVYCEATGTLGNSNTDSGVDYYSTLVTITKE